MVSGKIVEAGGELIGSNHPTWLAYAKKFNLTLRPIPEDTNLSSPLMLENRILTTVEAQQLYKELDAGVATLNDAARFIPLEKPWMLPNAPELDAVSMADWLAASEMSPLAKRAFRAEQESTQAAPLERQSYLAFLSMVKAGGLDRYWTDTESLRCAQGSSALANAFAATLDKRIVLNSPVISIIVGGDQVIVTTAEGRRFLAEDVILTSPAPTWKQIHFTPPLPDSLKPQTGPAVKYLAAVKRRFWTDANLSPNSITDGDLAETWEGTANQPGDHGAELTVFSGGPAAQHLRTRQPLDRHAFCQSQLATLYPTLPANFLSARFIDWPSDPATLTGYSFPAPRQVTTLYPTLHEGLGRLHFAGEHTNLQFPGYMEGALHSATTLTHRLCQRDQIPA